MSKTQAKTAERYVLIFKNNEFVLHDLKKKILKNKKNVKNLKNETTTVSFFTVEGKLTSPKTGEYL